ncbi:MAG: hypothetical protein ACO1NU_04665 [Arcticibacter sp.]
MKEDSIYSELSSIRSLMERSSKFISLSGLSGVMAGVYALVGAFSAQRLVQSHSNGLADSGYRYEGVIITQLFFIAIAVLVLSITTCIILTRRQSIKKGEPFWHPGSKRLLTNLSLPLLTGGIFIIILLLRGEYTLIIPSTLIFYGLALVSGSQYTFSDVKWLGLFEILLGLVSALFPQFSFISWILGFGILHILYGFIMHFKYKQ